jgi:hypothetical protein
MKRILGFVLATAFLCQCSSTSSRVPSSLAGNAGSNYQICSKALKKLIKDRDSIWTRSEPITVVNHRGAQGVLRFSHDTEITHAAIFAQILQSPKHLKTFEDLLERHSSPPIWRRIFFWTKSSSGYRVTYEDLQRVFKMSPKQIDLFVLRKGVDKSKNSFRITDLNPRFFDAYMEDGFAVLDHLKKEEGITGFSLGNRRALALFEDYQKLVDEILTEKGFDSEATRDLRYIELNSRGGQSNPARFAEELADKVWREFPMAAAHLHLSIPAIVPDAALESISRALETRIILRLARDASYGEGHRLSYSEFSTLVLDPDLAQKSTLLRARGVIKVTKNRFRTPELAHDIEIRQHLRHEDGLSDLEFATRLAIDHDKLRHLSDSELTRTFRRDVERVDDPHTANLEGALRYLNLFLRKRATESDIKTSDLLEGVIQKIGIQKGQILTEDRDRIAEILHKVDIDELVDVDLFLDSI